MEGFDGLTSAFDMDEQFDKAVEEVSKDIKVIDSQKKVLETKANNIELFEDKNFIQTELKSLIMSARTVMYKVEQDIKIGCSDRRVEVYAKLVETIGKQYQSLMELNKNIFEAGLQVGEMGIGDIGNNKISLTSDQLLDMINKASANSQMNEIEATFEVHDENIPEHKGD